MSTKYYWRKYGLFEQIIACVGCVVLIIGSATALAIKYEHAEGVPRDYTKAADLYCRAARSGYADAQYALGWMYANGRGAPRDDGVAAQLFAMASEEGHTQAREMLRYIQSSTPTPLPSCLLPEQPQSKQIMIMCR